MSLFLPLRSEGNRACSENPHAQRGRGAEPPGLAGGGVQPERLQVELDPGEGLLPGQGQEGLALGVAEGREEERNRAGEKEAGSHQVEPLFVLLEADEDPAGAQRRETFQPGSEIGGQGKGALGEGEGGNPPAPGSRRAEALDTRREESPIDPRPKGFYHGKDIEETLRHGEDPAEAPFQIQPGAETEGSIMVRLEHPPVLGDAVQPQPDAIGPESLEGQLEDFHPLVLHTEDLSDHPGGEDAPEAIDPLPQDHL